MFGIRGVGKSTWAMQHFPKAHRFDFLDERLFQAHLATPGLFRESLSAIENGEWIIVDEIQRLPVAVAFE